MTRTPSHHRPRAFTLIELLVTLILLGVFFMLAGRLFHATFKLAQNVTQAQDAAASFNYAVSVLRNDIFRARAVDVADQRTLTLTLDEGRRIVWTIDRTTASRGDGDRVCHWPIPPGATLNTDGPDVILTIAASKTTSGGEVRMTNEIQLLATLSK